MDNVYQFVSKPVAPLWAPSKKTCASWRLLSTSSVVPFKAAPIVTSPCAEDTSTLADLDIFTNRDLIPSVRCLWAEYMNLSFEQPVVSFYLSIDAKQWAKAKRQGNLGMLYGVEISNAIYRICDTINAWNPTVDDRNRARNGVKRIRLSYRMPVIKHAEG